MHIVSSPDAALVGQAIDLAGGRLVVGRSPGSSSGALTVADSKMSRNHLSLTVRGAASPVEVADLASKNGVWLLTERVTHARLGDGAVLRFGGTVVVLESCATLYPECAAPTAEIPGRSGAAQRLRGELTRAARTGLPILLQGATGTGKEFAALAVHLATAKLGRLVRFNIAAVPENLFEAEIFGHAKGAFTGAVAARLGRIREADGGTLILDEIGELALHLQPKLLRVLEEGLLRPVGASTDVTVDVRFVAATNADLDAAVAAGRFRRDLLARLRMHTVRLPLLAERRPDLIALADAMVPVANGWSQRLDPEAVQWLLAQAWSDNLRELKACLAALSVHGVRGSLPLALVREAATREPIDAGVPNHTTGRFLGVPPAQARTMVRPDPKLLNALLERHSGNVTLVAQELGRDRKQVYRWLEHYAVDLNRLLQWRRRGPATPGASIG